jgi:small-conductance mechanosensitive channel
VSSVDFPQNTTLLRASALLLTVAIDSWVRSRRPQSLSIAGSVGAFAVLTWFVVNALGLPLRPLFDCERSGGLLWQQTVKIGWWIVDARVVAAGVRALVALENRPHESRIVSDLLAAVICIATGLAITDFALAVPIGGMLATLGVIAIVLGRALQSTLADVFSGIAVGFCQRSCQKV